MIYTRREFGKVALAGLPAALLLERPWLGSILAQARPDSLINGVQLGVITYSYRQLPDQSAEATLKYVVESGISAIELMGGPAESFAGAPPMSGRGGPGGGGRGPGAPAAAAPAAVLPPGTVMIGGQPCTPGQGREGGPEGGRRGGGRGRGEMTPEQQAAQQAQADALKKWRTSVSMDKFKAFRKMYNDAGVSIYAVKILSPNMSDEEMDYVFNVAEALGCTHTTLELPNDVAALKRIGEFAVKKKIYAAYHTHLQGTMTAFDQAFAVSKGNMANVDFGHYVAAGNIGGTPVQFLEKFHDRIASFHLKDRTTPDRCALNLPFGAGDTPIKQILQTVQKNKWKMPATIEMEYQVPDGSDPVAEVKKCVQYCRQALTQS